jgi:hypothetical protein
MNSQRSLCLALALSAAATTAAPAASSGSCNYTFTEHANPLAGGQFYGRTIALSEDVLAATSTLSPTGSAVTVHERDFGGPGNWGLAKTLIPTGGAGTSFGAAVGVSGDTIVVGSPSEQLLGAYKGAVYVFERDRGGPGNWGLTQKIFGPNDPPGDFGVAV